MPTTSISCFQFRPLLPLRTTADQSHRPSCHGSLIETKTGPFFHELCQLPTLLFSRPLSASPATWGTTRIYGTRYGWLTTFPLLGRSTLFPISHAAFRTLPRCPSSPHPAARAVLVLYRGMSCLTPDLAIDPLIPPLVTHAQQHEAQTHYSFSCRIIITIIQTIFPAHLPPSPVMFHDSLSFQYPNIP